MSNNKSIKELRKEKSAEKANAKAQRIELAKKKDKRNKIIIICGCILTAAVLVVLGFLSANRESPNPSNIGYIPPGHVHGASCAH